MSRWIWLCSHSSLFALFLRLPFPFCLFILFRPLPSSFLVSPPTSCCCPLPCHEQEVLELHVFCSPRIHCFLSRFFFYFHSSPLCRCINFKFFHFSYVNSYWTIRLCSGIFKIRFLTRQQESQRRYVPRTFSFWRWRMKPN